MSRTTTASGLEYEDLEVGTGDEAKAGVTVTVHYTGWLQNAATAAPASKFDSSKDRNEPFRFPLGGGRVIRGWDEGVQGMKIGGKRRLVIPAALGYGARGAGGVIPAERDPDLRRRAARRLISLAHGPGLTRPAPARTMHRTGGRAGKHAPEPQYLSQDFDFSSGEGPVAIINGDDNPNTLTGTPDFDTINGFGGADIIDGAGGSDFIIGGTGADTLSGGDGIDALDYRTTNNGGVTVNLTTLASSGGDAQGDVIADDFENIFGSDFADTLTGNAVANQFYAGVGDDTLSGMAGDDTLSGDNGDDVLNGGDGSDVLYGGGGRTS